MAFSITTATGEERLLSACTDNSADESNGFQDAAGRRYNAFFNGEDVIFAAGGERFRGRWRLGTESCRIQRTERLPAGFNFLFFDHGPSPQRLHALWSFAGTVDQALTAWQQAGFNLSRADGFWNRRHEAASLHLRTRGHRWTGADSAHVVLPQQQLASQTTGNLHVGEFNPLIGWGIGFFLHQLERWRGTSAG